MGDRSFLFALLLRSDLFQLTPPVQFLHKATARSPLLLDLDEQLQKDPRAQQALDLLARRGPDLLEHRTLFADEDRLLPGALAIDRCGDLRHRQATIL